MTPKADPVQIDYQPLARPDDPEQALAAFIEQRLAPELAALAQAHAGAVHKMDLYDLGRRAGALRFEVSSWLAEAQRLLSQATAEQLSVAHRANLADRDEKAAAPMEILRANAKGRVALLQRAVDMLKYAREDLGSTLSFVQSSMRSMRDEELAELD